MEKIDKNSVLKAYEFVKKYVRESPLKKSDFFSDFNKYNLFLKLENLNPTGSFKIRGACNALLQNESIAKKSGVVAASAGNHAQGVARMSKELKADCTIFMPTYTPQVKVDATQSYGATVVLEGDNYDQSSQGCKNLL